MKLDYLLANPEYKSGLWRTVINRWTCSTCILVYTCRLYLVFLFLYLSLSIFSVVILSADFILSLPLYVFDHHVLLLGTMCHLSCPHSYPLYFLGISVIFYCCIFVYKCMHLRIEKIYLARKDFKEEATSDNRSGAIYHSWWQQWDIG